jgi:hypothetical protein
MISDMVLIPIGIAMHKKINKSGKTNTLRFKIIPPNGIVIMYQYKTPILSEF